MLTQNLFSANGQAYVLAAADGNQALSWISNLQEKRQDYIKVSSVLEDTAKEHERDRRTLRPPNIPVGALAEAPEDDQQGSPPSVRKIVRSKLRYVALEILRCRHLGASAESVLIRELS